MNVRYLHLAFKYAALLLIGMATVFTCGFGPPTLIDRDVAPSYRWSVGQLRQMQDVRSLPEGISSRAVFVYDVDADQVLLDSNADQPLPPASLTKLMTALLILEESNLQDQVTMIGADLIGGANMGAQAGETYTVEELLWGLLVPSANEAAMALARHHSGQVHVFVQRMNLRAQELGLAHTNFNNPEGFDEEGHVSSAKDLITVTRVLWQNPLFREIVGSAAVTVGGRALRTTNELLGVDPQVNGVKTGTTDEAGQCLILSVDRDGHQLYIVVMGSQDRFADARALKSAVATNYGWRSATIGARPTALDRLFDDAGNRWFLAAEGASPALLLPAWEFARLRPFRVLYPLPALPWTSGSEVGVLEWRLGDTIVGTQRLVLR